MVCFPAQTGITVYSLYIYITISKCLLQILYICSNVYMCFTFSVPKKDANVNVHTDDDSLGWKRKCSVLQQNSIHCYMSLWCCVEKRDGNTKAKDVYVYFFWCKLLAAVYLSYINIAFQYYLWILEGANTITEVTQVDKFYLHFQFELLLRSSPLGR